MPESPHLQPDTFYKETPFKLLMQKRIHKVLVVCSDYDFYMLEEDGRIDEHIFNEYVSLNLRYPPVFIHARSAKDALKQIHEDDIDLVIEMLSIGDAIPFDLAKYIKHLSPEIPVVILTPFSREVSLRLEKEDLSAVDHVFSWLGNPDIFLAIIKLMEDALNAEHDIQEIGVQAILLVEDSIRYISSYLPYLYRIILEQSKEFAREALNEHQQMLRRRGRPKILLAKNYSEALRIFERYLGNFQGIISDVSYKAAPNRRDTKAKAGLKYCQWIHEHDPTIPVLLQSSDAENQILAQKQGAGFLYKYSKNIYNELRNYILRHFGFGDFVFTDPKTGDTAIQAHNLSELEKIIRDIPDVIIEHHTRNDDFAKWMNARALFTIGQHFKNASFDDFHNAEAVRIYLHQSISEFRASQGKGIIAEFAAEKLDDYLYFSRIGEGGLGGKARGLAFMNATLKRENLAEKYPGINISIPPSIVLTTEVFDAFMHQNELYPKVLDESDDEIILQHFLNARLPEDILNKLQSIAAASKRPIAIRSSSRLEDSLYQPFAGVYNTYMIAPGDSITNTTTQLTQAVKSVYASAFYQHSKAYIKATSNLIDEEKMGIIIQTVCGHYYKDYFYPTISGVARSLNYYPVGKEKTNEGIAEIAFGLGKHIVEGGVSLRFSPSHPKNIMQFSTPQQTLKDSQKKFYALTTRVACFHPDVTDKINLEHLPIKKAEQDPNLQWVASSYDLQNNTLHDGIYAEGKKLVTFSDILNHDRFPLAAILRDLLQISSNALNNPVEIEFAAQLSSEPGDIQEFNYLQVRPIMDMDKNKAIDLKEIPKDRILLHSQKAMGHGVIEHLQDMVWIKTNAFNPANNKAIAVELNAINQKLKEQNTPYILIGPGRWGSSDPWLGIPVKWADISGAEVIVELGISGYNVDPSQGSHFFHNLTSFGVAYLSLSPHLKDGCLNPELLRKGAIVAESEYIQQIHFTERVTIYVNGRKSEGIVSL